MFGYVNTNKLELKMKDFYKYKAYYCGLCRTLKQNYGRLGQMTLTYDMTFLILLLTSLYESDTVNEKHRCLSHPVKNQDNLINEITEFAAAMNIALSYHHFQDDWQDEKKIGGLAGASLVKRDYLKIEKQYPDQCAAIESALGRLKAYEKQGETDLDLVSGCFGELMGALFVFKADQWVDTLRETGFYLGKFIFIMDAYDDLKQDLRKNSYNPLKERFNSATYEDDIRNILTMMMASCTAAFERLPCVQEMDILRNILYEGVWMRYDKIQMDNKEGKEK